MRRRNGSTVFERGDRVLEYWLAHSEGFAVVRGSVRRRVGGVVVDPADGRARTLLVRGDARGRSRPVPAASVVAVDPFDKVLYLEPRISPPSRARTGQVVRSGAARSALHVRSAAARTAPHVRRGGRVTASALTAFAALLWASAVRAAPHVKAHSLRLGRASVQAGRAAARWCRPHASAAAQGCRRLWASRG